MSRTSTDTLEALTTGHALPRVNLLPPEVHEARKLRRMRVGLGAGVALVAVAVGGLYLLQVQDANRATDELGQAQARTTVLQAQKAQYADVPKTLSAIDAAESARQTALATDVQWYRYLNDFSYVTPKNAWLSTLTVALNTAAPTTATPLAHPGVATVTITGAGVRHNDVAAWLDAVAKETGWTDAYFSNSEKAKVDNSNEVSVKFSSSATVTADALSHRYDRKVS